MKAFFIGLGSVGQRHLRNFVEIKGKDSEILAFRTTNHNLIIEEGVSRECNSLESHYGFKTVSSIEKGLEENPDVAFIANPSSKHLDIAIKLAQGGCNLFIEKPLSNSLDKVSFLQEIAKTKKLVVTVGYQTRFHPCYKKTKELVSEGHYGKTVSAGFEWGTYLPDHHIYEDYSKSYAARKDLGGGVTLGLSHEIDLIYSFWGLPEYVHALGGKLSTLDMETEDTVSVLMGFKQNNLIFPVSLFLSYAQKVETRKFRIQLENALILCDLHKGKIKAYDNLENVITEKIFSDLKRNDLFKEEIKEFLLRVENKDMQRASLYNDTQSLKLALKIKEKLDDKNVREF